MSNKDDQAIVSEDQSSRRQFIRRGAAFVAVAGISSSANNVYASDCDRNPSVENKAEVAGSDSDSGENADQPGCGKRPPPKISQSLDLPDTHTASGVVKIKA